MKIRLETEQFDENKIYKQNNITAARPGIKYDIGTIKLDNSYPAFANALRMILMDGLTIETLDSSESILETDDDSISIILLDRINTVKNFGKDKEFYIFVGATNSVDEVPIMSDDIRNKKNEPADVEKGILIGHLSPGRTIKVKNIKTATGNGLMHARFSAICGWKYLELDFAYIDFVNDRGFIEKGRKKKVYRRTLPKLKKPENIILSNITWEKFMGAQDKLIFAEKEVIYKAEEVPVGTKCKNFEIEFRTVFSAEKIYRDTLKTLVSLFELAAAAEIIEIGPVTQFLYAGTAVTGMILFEQINKVCDCFVNEEVADNYTKYKISIRHPDAKKIYAKTIDALIKEIKSL